MKSLVKASWRTERCGSDRRFCWLGGPLPLLGASPVSARAARLASPSTAAKVSAVKVAGAKATHASPRLAASVNAGGPRAAPKKRVVPYRDVTIPRLDLPTLFVIMLLMAGRSKPLPRPATLKVAVKPKRVLGQYVAAIADANSARPVKVSVLPICCILLWKTRPDA